MGLLWRSGTPSIYSLPSGHRPPVIVCRDRLSYRLMVYRAFFFFAVLLSMMAFFSCRPRAVKLEPQFAGLREHFSNHQKLGTGSTTDLLSWVLSGCSSGGTYSTSQAALHLR